MTKNRNASVLAEAKDMTVSEKPTRRSRKIWLIAGAVVIVLAVIGALGAVANRPAMAPTPPSGPNLTIWDSGLCSNSGNCGYSPVSKNVTRGTTLTWINTGDQPHTVTECVASDNAYACPNGAGSNTSNERVFDSNTQYSDGFQRDQTFGFTFNLEAGTYYYYCTIHPFMQGTIVVEAA